MAEVLCDTGNWLTGTNYLGLLLSSFSTSSILVHFERDICQWTIEAICIHTLLHPVILYETYNKSNYQ